MPKPLVQDIGHIIINVSDMDQALAFYRDLLGFRVAGKVNPVWTLVEADGGQLTLYRKSSYSPLGHGPKGEETPFAFHVESFSRAADLLESNGVRVKREGTHEGLVWDPFGNVLSLHDHLEE